MLPLLVFIVVISVALIISNTISMAVFASVIRDPYEVKQGIDYYLFSLSIADLMYSTLIAPLSSHSIIFGEWILGPNVCQAAGFLTVTVWAVNVNTFLWISVDRYLYVNDPKYHFHRNMKARCLCKICLTWMASALFCMVPLLVNAESNFSKEASVCGINWSSLKAYYLTIIVLLITPSLMTTFHNFGYIFYNRFKHRNWRTLILSKKKKYTMAQIENLMDTNQIMSLVLLLVFWMSWIPFMFYMYGTEVVQLEIDSVNRYVRFFQVWSGLSQSIWKLPIIVFCCPRYRFYFKELLRLPNRTRNYIPHDDSFCSRRENAESLLYI